MTLYYNNQPLVGKLFQPAATNPDETYKHPNSPNANAQRNACIRNFAENKWAVPAVYDMVMSQRPADGEGYKLTCGMKYSDSLLYLCTKKNYCPGGKNCTKDVRPCHYNVYMGQITKNKYGGTENHGTRDQAIQRANHGSR